MVKRWYAKRGRPCCDRDDRDVDNALFERPPADVQRSWANDFAPLEMFVKVKRRARCQQVGYAHDRIRKGTKKRVYTSRRDAHRSQKLRMRLVTFGAPH